VTLLELLRDALARVVWVLSELDPLVREQILEDLKHNVVGWLADYERRAA
jgi:hypothetical protein